MGILGNMLSVDYMGMIFPLSLLAPSKVKQPTERQFISAACTTGTATISSECELPCVCKDKTLASWHASIN